MYIYIDRDLVEFCLCLFVDICYIVFVLLFEVWMSLLLFVKMCNRSVYEECRCK